MASQQELDGFEVISQMVERAAAEADFRAELLANPRAVLAAQGVKVPDGVDIQVVDRDPSTMVIPLPPYVGDSIDLEELESVSGGSAAQFIKAELLGGRYAFLAALGFDLITGGKHDAADKVSKWVGAPIHID